MFLNSNTNIRQDRFFQNRNLSTYRTPQQQIAATTQPVVRTLNNPDIGKKKMKWGEPTWFFFHTLAEKVKDSEFLKIRLEIINIIISICGSLPCPLCSNHASEYMKKSNINNVRTKQDLKEYLWKFHNEVNERKGFILFPISDLDEKYSKANLIPIINNFIYFFQEKTNNVKNLSIDLHKDIILKKVKLWLQQNMSNFDV